MRVCLDCSEHLADASVTCSACGSSHLFTLLSPGTLLQQRYRIRKVLATGGYGAVYDAADTRLKHKQWAVKELLSLGNKNEDQEQFETEAHLLSLLSSPLLPSVNDYFEESNAGSNRFYIVMEYVAGQTLQDILETKAPAFLDERDVTGWAMQACQALAELHRQQPPIVHRDIKPGNIKLLPDGSIKLIDLGIAKAHYAGNKTARGARGVTPGFSPVEQYGSGTDMRSDIYALGATLYLLLTHQTPVPAPDRMTQPLPPPRSINPKISAGMEFIILKAMEVRPDGRFQTIQAMRQALTNPAAALASQPASSGPAVSCPKCGSANRSASKFCKQCGTALPSSTPVITPSIVSNIKPVPSPAASAPALKPGQTRTDAARNHNTIGEQAYQRGNYKAALAAFQQAVVFDPNIALYRYNIGRAAHQLEQMGTAIGGFMEAVQREPGNADYQGALAEAFYIQGQYSLAAQHYEEAIRLKPDNAVFHYHLAAAYHNQGQYTAAADAYKQAVQFDPKNSLYRKNLGDVYFDQGQYSEAIDAYAEAARLEPKKALYYNRLGAAYYEQGRYTEAARAYGEAARLESQKALYHHNLGIAYSSLQQYWQALAAYTQAAKLEPSNALYQDSLTTTRQRLAQQTFGTVGITPTPASPPPTNQGIAPAQPIPASAATPAPPVIQSAPPVPLPSPAATPAPPAPPDPLPPATPSAASSQETPPEIIPVQSSEPAESQTMTLAHTVQAVPEPAPNLLVSQNAPPESAAPPLPSDAMTPEIPAVPSQPEITSAVAENVLLASLNTTSGQEIISLASLPLPLPSLEGLLTSPAHSPVMAPLEPNAVTSQSVPPVDFVETTTSTAPAPEPTAQETATPLQSSETLTGQNSSLLFSPKIEAQPLISPDSPVVSSDGEADRAALSAHQTGIVEVEQTFLAELSEAKFTGQTVVAEEKTVQSPYLLGLDELELGHFHDASLAFQQALHQEPQNAAAAERLGYCYVQLRNPAAALTAFEQAARLAPQTGNYHRQLGEIRFSLGQYDSAVTAFQEALRLEKPTVASLYRLGETLALLGRMAEAAVAYKQAIHLDPNQARYSASLGDACLAQDLFEEAASAYQEALQRSGADNASGELYNRLGDALYEQGRTQEAEVAYAQAVRLDPACAVFQGNLGTMLLDLERYTEAESALGVAVRLEQNNALYRNNLGLVYLRQGHLAQAENTLREAVRLDPTNAAVHAALATTYAALGQHIRAWNEFSSALKLTPSRIERASYSNGQGCAAFAQSHYEEARAAFAEAGALDDSEAVYQVNLAAACIALLTQQLQATPVTKDFAENWETAQRAYEKALRIAPKNADYHRLLGDLLSVVAADSSLSAQSSDLRSRAIEAYQDALKLGNNAALHNRIGLLYLQERDFTRAVLAFQDSLRETRSLSPADEALYSFNLGTALIGCRQYTLAVAALERATQLSIDNAGYATSLGLALLGDGRPAEALPIAERAVRLARQTESGGNRQTLIQSLRLLGETNFALGRWSDAAGVYQHATQLAPTDARLYLLLGVAYEREGIGGAAVSFQQAVQCPGGLSDPVAHLNLGTVLLAQSTSSAQPSTLVAASAAFQEALRLGERQVPGVSEEEGASDLETRALAATGLGKAEYLQGRFESAVAVYDQALGAILKLEKRGLKLPTIDSSTVYMSRGLCWERLGRYEEAAREYQQALQGSSGDLRHASYSNALGDAAFAQGNYGAAAAAYRQAALSAGSLAPRTALYYNNYGAACAAQQKYEEAALAYQRAIDLDGQSIYHLALGQVLALGGDFSGAASAFTRALACSSRPDPHLQGLLGDAWAAQGHYDQAAAAHRQAALLSPIQREYHEAVGTDELALGHYPEAIRAYQQALRCAGEAVDNAILHNQIGAAFHLQGGRRNSEAAVLEYEAATQLDPRETAYWMNLGDAYFEQALDETALPATVATLAARAAGAYASAARLSPDTSEYLAALGTACWKEGDFPAACSAYTEAVRLAPQVAVYHNNLGAALAAAMHYEEAIVAYREAVQIDPDHPLYHANLAAVAYEQAAMLVGAGSGPSPAGAILPPSALALLRTAVQEWQAAISLNTDVPSSVYGWIGHALSGLGQYAAAADAYSAALSSPELSPADTAAHLQRASLFASLGEVLVQQGDLVSAATAYAEAIALAPGEATYQARLGTTHYQLGHFAEAALAYMRAALLDPTNAEYCNSLGNANYQQGTPSLQAAVGHYQQAVRLEPGNALYQHNLGTALFEQEHYVSAAASFREAVRLDPGQARYHFRLGVALIEQDDPVQASAEFAAAVALTQGAPVHQKAEYLAWLGSSLARQHRREEAIGAYEQATALDATKAGTYQRILGDLYVGAGRYNEAQLAYTRALQAIGGSNAPDGEAALQYQLGNAAFLGEDFPVAITAYKQAIASAVRSSPAGKPLAAYYLSLGDAYLTQHPGRDVARAFAAYEEATRLNKQDAVAFNKLGGAAYALRHFKDAVVAYTQATRLAPERDDYYNNLGLACYQLGDLSSAGRAYREALRLQFRQAQYHNNLGMVCYALSASNQSTYEEAAMHYQRAARLEPTNPEYQTNLGNALFSSGQYMPAALAYQEATRLAPDRADYQHNLGNAYHNQGHYARAQRAYEEAVRLAPQEASYHLSLGDICMDQELFGEAAAAFRLSAQLVPDNATAHYKLGLVSSYQQLHDQAVAAFRTAVRLEPGNALYHFNLGRELEQSGDKGAARSVYEDVLHLAPGNGEALQALQRLEEL